MKNLLYILVIYTLFNLTTSCKSIKMNTEDEYSDLPWNEPAPWEGQGRLGGLIPQNR